MSNTKFTQTQLEELIQRSHRPPNCYRGGEGEGKGGEGRGGKKS